MGGALFVESLCTRAVYRAAHCREQIVPEYCVPDLALEYRVACRVREARHAASQSRVRQAIEVRNASEFRPISGKRSSDHAQHLRVVLIVSI
jgi:hypothetical protein